MFQSRNLCTTIFCLAVLSASSIAAEPTEKIDHYLRESIIFLTQEPQRSMGREELMQMYGSYMCPLDRDGRIFVQVYSPDRLEDAQAIAVALGGEVDNTGQYSFYVWMPLDMIFTLAEYEEVNFIGPIGMPVSKTGSVLTAGDRQLFADIARDRFYTRGSEIKVGVISNGINYYGNSISSGDLPVFSVVDNAFQYILDQEGVAMMEIVHDIAPNSLLYFGGVGRRTDGFQTWYDTPLNMAQRITSLSNVGCRVIVDDIGWLLGAPYYEDYEIAASIYSFLNTSSGAYISAAGNDALQMYGGIPSIRWEREPYWVIFSGVDTTNQIQISNADSVLVVLQWADRWIHSSANFDLYGSIPGGPTYQSTNPSGYGIPPEERIVIRPHSPGPINATATIKVKWVNYPGSDKHLRLLAYSFGSSSSCTLVYRSTNEQVYGHSAAERCISVAASNAADSNNIASYSSRGPSTMLQGGSTNTVLRNTPVITGTDGVETKIGVNQHFPNPFYGTSAAAPHIAGIAALYFSRYPGKSTNQFINDLTLSAARVGTIGQGGVYNGTSGYGKARAYDAIIKGLTVLNSPIVSGNDAWWDLVRVTGTGRITSGRRATISAMNTALIEGTVLFDDPTARLQVYGTLILAPSASVDPSNIDVLVDGRIIGGNFVLVTVNQVDENSVSFDSVGRWRSGGFQKFPVPDSFNALNNSTETFRSKQDFKTGTTQKYNNWENYSDVVNHQSFTIDTLHNRLQPGSRIQPVISPSRPTCWMHQGRRAAIFGSAIRGTLTIKTLYMATTGATVGCRKRGT